MKYINTATKSVHYEHEVKALFPNTSFPIPFEAPDGYVALVDTMPPDHNQVTHQAREITPVLVNGTWQQAWGIVSKFTEVVGGPTIAEQEAEALAAHAKSLVPQKITAFQAKAALLNAGMLDAIEAMMSAPETPRIVKLAWFEALHFERQSPTVAAMAAAFGLSDADVDALFVYGSGVTA